MEVSEEIKPLGQARLAGDKFYFTGKPCKRGHVCRRYTNTRTCFECHTQAFQAWKAANPESRRASLNKWKKKNAAKHAEYVKKSKQKKPELYHLFSKAWVERNPEKRKQLVHKYYDKNKAKVLACVNLRRTRLLQACPWWVDIKEITRIYSQRRKISLDTGVPHHVDHIVPLRGKSVCGLHVPWNLRIIPATDNRRKGSRVDMELLEKLYAKA